MNHVLERNVAADGYNLGLKYQCVEFVKRYYYEYFNHKMPDTYGHAKDFFNPDLPDGNLNKQRNLIQYKNGSLNPPKLGDILIYKPVITNPYGHVAIVSKVNLSEGNIEIIQQNPGPFSESREIYLLENKNENWFIKNERILGWLHKI
ncbi:CHAP domain-containing protein [Aliivibrio fischeri]|uniref:CHAP domain-containing protein n=1 Tax=Aliivibrio fischeri TaxID=668 RepID=UPI000AD8995E|nr:CHAP domain-containing protein [Aliivibrio fischeri]MCE7575787.1 CHAP domain-containing protein [Aliivibrio fischeri]